ncbi:Cytochrome P450 52A11 [Beauveria bassiana D1-5]|uniref:Cytochrome P450 52A11 n=1 Tax=Beauveria bassiana D1-5 TaxID=1245745 RepID=A0A0A2VY06_BEABA|nr:Cytochrome P450 52A11 [Beauveria bassiana D1-5]
MTFVTLVFAASALAYYALRALLNVRNRANKTASHLIHDELPTYPHLEPFWGLDLYLCMWRDFTCGRLAEGMRMRHMRHGPTFWARELLGGECIYTIDPENIRAVTTSQFAQFQKAAWVAEASKHIGRGVLMNEGEAWRRSRALLKPVFAKTTLDELALVEPHVKAMIAVIRDGQQGGAGRAFDFSELARRFSLDVVTEFLFDGSVESLGSSSNNNNNSSNSSSSSSSTDGADFLCLVKAFEPACGLFIAVGALAWLKLAFSYRKLLAVVGGMKAFFKQRLDLLREEQQQQQQWYRPGGDRSSSTSLFRMLEKEGLSVDDMQAELQNIFFASFDTTTALLANLVRVLAERPDVQEKLRGEMAHLDGRRPTRQDISAMPYLRSVLTPSLHTRRLPLATSRRRHDASPRRRVVVRAGTTIVWSVYALNRNPAHYGDDWAAFRPERWCEGGASSSAHAAYFMPFGSGPRSCIGQQMAQTEISYVLVRLLQAFGTLESRDDRPFCEAEAVSFYNAHGTMVEMS